MKHTAATKSKSLGLRGGGTSVGLGRNTWVQLCTLVFAILVSVQICVLIPDFLFRAWQASRLLGSGAISIPVPHSSWAAVHNRVLSVC